MRHLWLLHPSKLPDWIGWKRSDTDDQEPEPHPSNASANADADLIKTGNDSAICEIRKDGG
jgi:hypothetical protein